MEANRRHALALQQLHRHHGTPDGSGIINATTNVASSDLLTPQQEAVLRAVQQGCSIFITGSAGTGKSFLLGHIIAALRRIHQPDAVFVTASTGIAACALGGQTLHSFAGIGLGRGDRDTLLRRAATSHGAAKRWRRAAALVIDEISMVDGGVFDALDYIARALRWQHRRWGGLQLVVSGDFFQLPPIKAPDPTKEFAFEADCWDSSFDLQVELTHVFRQSDSRLIDLLQGIRRGEPIPQQHLLPLLEPCSKGGECDRDDEENVTRLFPRNDDVRRVNEERLRSLGREVITFVAADTGSEPWRSQLRQGIAPEVLELCVGARVMLIKNTDPAAGLVNGSTGVVTGFIVEEEEDGGGGVGRWRLLPRVRFERGTGGGSVEVTVRREKWDVMEGEKVMARRTQVPLILAWALSVHKCQGMTLERLHTDLSRAFGCGMVYVALSRVRSLDGLRLSGGGFDPGKVKAHPKVVQFYHHHLASSGPPTPLLLPPAGTPTSRWP
ncbi:hypothetical protein Taro_025362 [Colocasia esculenta]|uniref:ATP-dependent DNA helicase n=1 Tax=Colocasia esculenta TaxID=4460 RepID=A0A843V8P7_COLES|nr:hypothetical protein [Colocasia esculenta]